MNRKMKKILAVVCAISMVVTSMTGLRLTSVVADTTTTIMANTDVNRDALVEEANNADYNFALGKEASVSLLTTTDGTTDLSILTNGTFPKSNAKTTIIEINRGNLSTDTWVQVDLGKAYDTSKIDRIVTQYKNNNTSPKTGYQISYSLNGVDFVTVAEVGAMTGSNYQINIDKITLTEEQKAAIPYARYVRLTLVGKLSYGLQIQEMAVLTDGTTKVSEVDSQEVETADNPALLDVTSSDYNQFEFKFTAGEGQEDYTYSAYVDNSLYSDNVLPDQTYTITDATGGTHSVKIVSHKGDLVSSGIIKTVEVVDYQTYLDNLKLQECKDLLLSDRNLALGKTATPSSIRENDNPSNITDGVLTGNTDKLFRTTSNSEPANIVIDLGQNYRLDAIEKAVGLYSDANRHPQNYTIDFSLNGTDFQTVATSNENFKAQSVEVDVTDCTLPAVRYVRFSLYNPINGMGFQMYELGVIAKEGADLTPVEVATVNDPASFEVEVTDYNTAQVTITAGEGQEDYKYNVYIDSVPVLEGVEAGTHVIEGITSGERLFTVKSVVDGVTSTGISTTKTVNSASTYNCETGLTGGTVEGGKILEENKTVGEVTYNNYSLFKKAIASASSQENDTLIPSNVLDGLNTTRWSSAHSDPQWIIVDLGAKYDIYEIDIVWQNASAKDFTVEYSVDGETYKKVCIVEGAAANSRYENIVLTDVAEARYVKINGTARTGVYGYSIWDLGIYGPDSEDTTPADVKGLTVAAGVATWQASAYATSYNVYCGGQLVGTTAELTYDFSDVFTADGEYEVGVQAVGDDGKKSEITTITVQYDEEETTTPTPEVKFGWEIQYPDGNGFVPTDFEMPGFTIEGIPADTEKWVCGARLQNIPVEAGKVYTVSFTVTSSVNKVVPVEFTNGTGGYINVNATPEGAEYSQQFTAVGNTVKLYMPLGVDTAVDGTISEPYSITVSNVQVVEYVEEDTTPEETTTPEPEVTKYEVSVDGLEVATVEEGAEYTLPTDSVNGYVCGEDAYKAGTIVTVTSDMAFTSIGDVTVTAAQGAGIRYTESAGIRFQATVNASDEVLAAVQTGMIITANDIYNAHNQVLTLDAIADKNEYAALNVVNNGWYNDVVGTYCGSIVNINEANYIRDFIAVAYATITYTDGTTTTVYSNMTGVRSIKGVAQAVQAAGYVGIADAYHATIDAYAAAK